jgi:hypothetical protein
MKWCWKRERLDLNLGVYGRGKSGVETPHSKALSRGGGDG